ncbi:PREDICTED: TPR repeat-containing thioredoxin TTL1-like [Nelumbo nucifera]|uniref:TPR repeat-containing thioredoxin TTL1-like n=2 Tax=Nelumbo nucifera TaxID=4432 RepID=A0A1U8BPJ5_NELNU|nr:PREDICTED: TPR repeat-containing thioredoxin TTL1-like [Nelumbo nucifera]
MSHPGKPIPEIGYDSLSDRFRGALNFEHNKPDFKELDLGSPVSPLRTRGPGGGVGGGPAASGITTTSSSSSSSGSVSGKTGNNPVVKRSDGGGNNHSGELSGSSESSPTASESVRSAAAARNSKPGHRRSNSGGAPLIYSGGSVTSSSGGSSVNSPVMNVLPSGNICPSGRILKTGMACRSSTRSDVLGSGTGNYGHGSIMRGVGGGKLGSGSGGETTGGNVTGNIQFAGESMMVKRAMASSDPEEIKRAGNEQYRRRNFAEALCLYDRAIAMSPDNAACRSNRAAALAGLGRLGEAVRECEEAVRLDPGYWRAHQRLASLHLRLGQVENARKHLCFPGQQPDPVELQKLQAVERHLNKCADARKVGDWKSALREGDAAIAAGADSSPQLFACRAEVLLKLHQLEDADSGLSRIPKFEWSTPSCSQTKFCGMLAESYVFFVRAQVEMALGRFENAVAAAEKAGHLDPRNIEISMMLSNVRLVARARARGNELFNSGKFAEACSAYGEGLKFDPSNSVLYCNRAACWSKLGQWERSVEDCTHALKIQPNYTKALLRRAASNGKLERWAESVRDYEVLIKELPGDNEVAEALFHAQVALKKSRGEEVYNMKFGGEVEEVSGLDQFRAAISSPGVSVVHFKAPSNQQCEQISPFFDTLCHQYPSMNFLKVDVNESPAVAKAESVRIVPTFKIYKNGSRVKEMICPSHQVLEYSVRHYSL